jgi:hypothetical protein
MRFGCNSQGKRPRWLLATLATMSLCGTVALAGFWWIFWPARTMSDFASMIVADQFVDANQMLEAGRWVSPDGYVFLEGPGRRFQPEVWQSQFDDAELVAGRERYWTQSRRDKFSQ